MGVIASTALTEPGAGSDAGALSTTPSGWLRKKSGDYVLDGVKQFASGAQHRTLMVTARTGAEESARRVGVHRRKRAHRG